MNAAAVVVVLLAVGACEHSEPFEPRGPAPLPPLGEGPAYRATFNPGDDRTPSWLPDGSGIVYSTEREDRRDDDRCLAVIPAGSGTIRRLACNRVPASDDSTDVWEAPAVNEAGDLLYLRVVSRIGRQKRDLAELMLAPFDDPARARRLIALPYTAEDGRLHSGAADIRWVGPDRFVYLAQRLIYEGSTFFPDTFLTGVAVVEATIEGATVTRRLVPGTEWASSVDADAGGDAIYYTLGGDSRVYRQSLGSGAVAIVHDFGAGNVARGVQVRGGRLAAVVGGSVLFRDEGVLEMVQRDEGGALVLADLATGAELPVTSSPDSLFHRPALSPDGERVVIEAAPFAPVHDTPSSEYNATNHRHDLWLIDLP